MAIVTTYNWMSDEEFLREATDALRRYRADLPESVVELFLEMLQRYEDNLDSLRDIDVNPALDAETVADATGAP